MSIFFSDLFDGGSSGGRAASPQAVLGLLLTYNNARVTLIRLSFLFHSVVLPHITFLPSPFTCFFLFICCFFSPLSPRFFCAHALSQNKLYPVEGLADSAPKMTTADGGQYRCGFPAQTPAAVTVFNWIGVG